MKWMKMWFILLGTFFCAFQGGAHPKLIEHKLDAMYTIEGYEGKLGEIVEEMYKRLDAMQIDGVRLSAMNHRDLFHPVLFGQPIPAEKLDSVARTYGKATGKAFEESKQILLQARAKYIRECTDLVARRTGLPKRQAEALGGLLQIVHLLGDADVLDNARFGAIPNSNEIVRALNHNLDTLFKGADDTVKRGVEHLKLQILKLKAKFVLPKDERVFVIALRRLLMQRNLGELLHQRWGNTLAKSGIMFNEITARQASRSAINLYRQEGAQRSLKLSSMKNNPQNGNMLAELGIPDKNLNKMITRRINASAREATEELSSSVVLEKGIVQKIKGPNGKVMSTLTIPIRQVGKGVMAGASAGVLTFIFSQGITYAMYQEGILTDEEYITECEKNIGASFATGACTYVLVALGATPSGWIILGIGVTIDTVYSISFDEIQWVNSFSLERDWIFGTLPTEIQRRHAPLVPAKDARGLFNFSFDRVTVLDFTQSGEIQSRASPLDYSSVEAIQERSSFLDPSSNKRINERRGFPL